MRTKNSKYLTKEYKTTKELSTKKWINNCFLSFRIVNISTEISWYPCYQ